MADEHFDAVIIGSGFGGSVMAYRLAEAGLSVCLLERGQAFPPQSFPRAPYSSRGTSGIQAVAFSACSTSGPFGA